ncbi:MAG: hypothetical protein K0U20_09470 [Proteobacteria bacterium]|nr:hypothetical protein [Pseudomonadota bacterium]MCH9735755.1 hypothetical protein [Actinomycetes bacterium]
MATIYANGNGTAWVDTGVTGPCTISEKMSESLIHFGATLPATYNAGPHHHVDVKDQVPFYYWWN